MMGLSATVVREALHWLVGMKVVNIVHGRGAYVSQVSAKDLIRPEALLFVMQRETLLQAIEVRGILELEAIALAAERATPGDLLEMERALQRIERALASGNEALMYSPSFHLAVAAATHNPVLVEIIKHFIGLMERGAKVVSNNVAEAVHHELESHKELYEALRSRDPQKARDCTRAHLEEAKRLVSQGFTGGVDGQSDGQIQA